MKVLKEYDMRVPETVINTIRYECNRYFLMLDTKKYLNVIKLINGDTALKYTPCGNDVLQTALDIVTGRLPLEAVETFRQLYEAVPEPATTHAVISRKEARRQGLTKYFTGKRCKNGHISQRYTKSGICCACQGLRQQGVLSVMSAPKSIMSKEEAIRLGMNKYFTGEPCVNGHISPRYVNNGVCCECQRQAVNNNRDPLIKELKAAYNKMLASLTDSDKAFIKAGMGVTKETAIAAGIGLYKEGEVWVKLQ